MVANSRRNKEIDSLRDEWDIEYRQDFRRFLWLVWHNIDEIKADPSIIQYDIARYLQTGPQRTCIEALRGLGKSYITCAYAAWRLMNDPAEAILIVSASEKKAKKNGRFIRDLIYQMDILKPLRLTDATRNDRNRKIYDNALEFDVEGGGVKQVPSVNCVGVEGQVTGDRATIIICDDIEVSTNSRTKSQREKIEDLVTEFDAVIKPGKDNRIIYLGTPHSSDSLYNRLATKGYAIQMWPAEVPTEDWMESYGHYLGKCIRKMMHRGDPVGTPTDPRFDKWELLQRKTSMRAKYAQQYLLDIKQNDEIRFPLKLRNLVITDLDRDQGSVHIAWASSPELIWKDLDPVCFRGDACYRPFRVDPRLEHYEDSIMIVDPSGAGADKTAVCVLKLLYGRLFCTELIGLSGGYSQEVLERISRIARDQKVNKIIIETNMGGGGDEGGAVGALLKPVLAKYHKCDIGSKWNHKQKELRICETLEPVVNLHKLVIDKRIIERDDELDQLSGEGEGSMDSHKFCHQFTKVTRERGCLDFDDLIDALAMGVEHFIEKLSKDEDEARDEFEQDQFEKSVAEFQAMAGGTHDHDQDQSMFSSHSYGTTHGLN